MNKNKIYFGAVLLILLVITVWAFYGMFNTGKAKEVHNVSVIVDDSNNDRWIALHEGLTQAANDYDIDLNFVSTGEFKTVEEEIALINREIDNGAEGVIVQMVSSIEQEQALEEISTRAAVMLLETDVMPEDVYALTGADNTAMGAALAETIKADMGDALVGKKVGILCGNQKQTAMQQRLDGFKTGLCDTGAEIAWVIDCANDESADSDTIQRAEEVDIVAALENDETEHMVDALQRNGRTRLYGVGCSEKAVYYLDKGVIHTLVVPNEFNMGYQSMESLANRLRYRLAQAESCEVEYLVVNRESLYAEDNQKVLFPIVQ